MIGRRQIFSAIGAFLGFGVAAKAEHIPTCLSDETLPVSARFRLLYDCLQRAEEDAERREVSLAGCSVAAHGGTKGSVVAKREDWAWHPAYQDVLELRRKFDVLSGTMAERLPMGLLLALYPCGCSAMGSADLPRYCAEHDPQANRQNEASLILGTNSREAMTFSLNGKAFVMTPERTYRIA